MTERIAERERLARSAEWRPISGSARTAALSWMVENMLASKYLRSHFGTETWYKTLEKVGERDVYDEDLATQAASDLRTSLFGIRGETLSTGKVDRSKWGSVVVNGDKIFVIGKAKERYFFQAEADLGLLVNEDVRLWNVENSLVSVRHLSNLGSDSSRYNFEVIETRGKYRWVVTKNSYDLGKYHFSPRPENRFIVCNSGLYTKPENEQSRYGYIPSKLPKDESGGLYGNLRNRFGGK